MRPATLDEVASGTVAADGTCVVTIGPTRRQIWRLNNVGVQSDSAAQSTARLYVGPNKWGKFIGGTFSGNVDSIPVAISLTQNGLICVVWENATPGARCILTPFGRMDVPS